MRRRRFTVDRIIGVLSEHEAGVTADLCRKHGNSDARLLQLEVEVRRADGARSGKVASAGGREPPAEEAAGGVDVGRVGAEGSARKKLNRSAERYAAVEKLMADHGFSEGRACRLIGVNRSTWQYEPLRAKDDVVRERMREIANERRGFGYRRLAILLRR